MLGGLHLGLRPRFRALGAALALHGAVGQLGRDGEQRLDLVVALDVGVLRQKGVEPALAAALEGALGLLDLLAGQIRPLLGLGRVVVLVLGHRIS